jgi:hypothetical protein
LVCALICQSVSESRKVILYPDIVTYWRVHAMRFFTIPFIAFRSSETVRSQSGHFNQEMARFLFPTINLRMTQTFINFNDQKRNNPFVMTYVRNENVDSKGPFIAMRSCVMRSCVNCVLQSGSSFFLKKELPIQERASWLEDAINVNSQDATSHCYEWALMFSEWGAKTASIIFPRSRIDSRG